MIKCNIRYLMIDNNIETVLDLMKITGINRVTLNKVFKIQDIGTIKLENLMKICDALNCNLSDLIEYIPEKNISAEN